MKSIYLSPIPALLLLLGVGINSPSYATPLTLNDLPVTIMGTTGGEVSNSCGNIPVVPHLELSLDSASSLNISVNTTADAILWIDGPSDFCVLRDAATNQLDTSGFWPEGLYKLYVGDRQGTTQLPFSMTVSK
jgi:hypothetical protein